MKPEQVEHLSLARRMPTDLVKRDAELKAAEADCNDGVLDTDAIDARLGF
jgi:hypothetical protein